MQGGLRTVPSLALTRQTIQFLTNPINPTCYCVPMHVTLPLLRDEYSRDRCANKRLSVWTVKAAYQSLQENLKMDSTLSRICQYFGSVAFNRKPQACEMGHSDRLRGSPSLFGTTGERLVRSSRAGSPRLSCSSRSSLGIPAGTDIQSLINRI